LLSIHVVILAKWNFRGSVPSTGGRAFLIWVGKLKIGGPGPRFARDPTCFDPNGSLETEIRRGYNRGVIVEPAEAAPATDGACE
jgi:hypothetical protein